MNKKLLEISEFKSYKSDEGHYITGYANTKGKEDAYGDIPTNYKNRPVYDLSKFKRNPVALADHQNSVGNIIGSFVFGEGGTAEDEKGLFIKLRLMDNPQTDIAKHAVEALKSGFARAFSIGGQWLFEDSANPKHLTKAIIGEISAVAQPADSYAMSSNPKPKAKPEIEEEATPQKAIEALLNEYSESGDDMCIEKIKRIKECQK